MKQKTIQVSFDDERLDAVRMFLEQRGIRIEDEMCNYIEVLYNKYGPQGVRDYIDKYTADADDKK